MKSDFDVDEVFKINTVVENTDRGQTGSIDSLGEGLKKHIYSVAS